MVVRLFRSFKFTVWVSVRVTPDAIANVAVFRGHGSAACPVLALVHSIARILKIYSPLLPSASEGIPHSSSNNLLLCCDNILQKETFATGHRRFISASEIAIA